MRDFDASELNEKMPLNLVKELEKEEEKAKETEARYRDTLQAVKAARFRRRSIARQKRQESADT
jgi:hypothetical protein